MPLNSEAFKYYDSNGEYQVIRMGFDSPAAKPFVVRLGNPGWIPCNVLVFAADAADAVSRVIAAVNMVCRMHWKHRKRYVPNRYHDRKFFRDRAFGLRKQIKTGMLKPEVEPLDRRSISQIQWASNDSVC